MSLVGMDFYIDELRKNNYAIEKNRGSKPTFIQRTYGCQMNEHDSEYVDYILQQLGYEKSEQDMADLMLINTCAIRHTAANKAYGFIGSLKKEKKDNPGMTLVVSGCLPELEQAKEDFIKSYKHIDILMGTSSYYYLPKYIYQSLSSDKTVLGIDDQYDFEGSEIMFERLYKHKSFVNINYGCNNFCTYCIVPYTRGRERSRGLQDIVKEVNLLVNDGVKEVTLLGQNVNSYGKGLKIKTNFSDLLTELDKIKDLKRIRFMTSHPKDISDQLLEAYGKLESLCPHLHLPIQSGSDKVLKEMNRHYSAENYLKTIKKLKNINSNISLSTDIMVGFPGEDEDDFQATLDIVREVEYDFAYTFIYSPREGTKASQRLDQVPQDIKTDRFNRLTELINKITLKKNQKLIGKKFQVLVDELSKTRTSFLSGRTGGFKLVNFEAKEDLIGEFVDVEITGVNTFALEGKVL